MRLTLLEVKRIDWKPPSEAPAKVPKPKATVTLGPRLGHVALAASRYSPAQRSVRPRSAPIPGRRTARRPDRRSTRLGASHVHTTPVEKELSDL